MSEMKQTRIVLNLRDFTSSSTPFGNIEGKAVFRKLVDFVEQHPDTEVFGVSLDRIEATDASFPRESVIALAKQLRGERCFFLSGVRNRDVIDNWNYAAQAKEQPLTIWHESAFEVIGPELNASTRTLLDYVLNSTQGVRASQVSADLDLSIPNASTRLKNLVAQGYIMRASEVADSGGVEFRYLAIR